MTSSRTPSLRLLWALLALVQFSVTVGGPLVDAALERGSDRVVHVESEAGDECGVHHDHLFCQVCRTVALAGRDSAPVRAPRGPIQSDDALAVQATNRAPSSPGSFAPVGPRAPPRA